VSAGRARNLPILVADAQLPEVLSQVRLDTARSIVVATSDDLVNLEIALTARTLRADIRVVLRLFDPDLADRAQSAFNIHYSRSISALAAPAFAAAAMGRHVDATFQLENQVLISANVSVAQGSAAAGMTVAAVE